MMRNLCFVGCLYLLFFGEGLLTTCSTEADVDVDADADADADVGSTVGSTELSTEGSTEVSTDGWARLFVVVVVVVVDVCLFVGGWAMVEAKLISDSSSDSICLVPASLALFNSSSSSRETWKPRFV